MAAPAILQHQIDIGQDQVRRLAQIVAPAHLAVANHDLALGQQPFGSRTIVFLFRVDQNAGDEQVALCIAFNLQIGLIDFQ